MKAILISIKPKWCAKIMNGDKTIEIRKNKALATAIQKLIDKNGYAELYVYCTKRHRGYTNTIARLKNNKFINFDKPDEIMPVLYDIEQTGFDGKVVAKFTLNKVEELRPFFHWCEILQKKTCLSYDEVLNYLDKSEYITAKKQGIVYAWNISNLKIFDKPKELSEFHKIGFHEWCAEHPPILSLLEPKKCYEELKQFMITKAPQNFCYVEGLE